MFDDESGRPIVQETRASKSDTRYHGDYILFWK